MVLALNKEAMLMWLCKVKLMLSVPNHTKDDNNMALLFPVQTTRKAIRSNYLANRGNIIIGHYLIADISPIQFRSKNEVRAGLAWYYGWIVIANNSPVDSYKCPLQSCVMLNSMTRWSALECDIVQV